MYFCFIKNYRISTFLFQAVNFRALLHNYFSVVPLPCTCIEIISVVSSFKLAAHFFFKIIFGNLEFMKTRKELAANTSLYLCKLKDAVEQFRNTEPK